MYHARGEVEEKQQHKNPAGALSRATTEGETMKPLRLSLMILAMTQAALAQDWAKEKLARSPRHFEWVTVKHDERSVDVFVVYPESKDKRPVVLIIHEIFGMTDWVQDLADQVAEAGYIAVAPDLLSGMGPPTVGEARPLN